MVHGYSASESVGEFVGVGLDGFEKGEELWDCGVALAGLPEGNSTSRYAAAGLLSHGGGDLHLGQARLRAEALERLGELRQPRCLGGLECFHHHGQCTAASRRYKVDLRIVMHSKILLKEKRCSRGSTSPRAAGKLRSYLALSPWGDSAAKTTVKL